jgi:protein SCO1/2
MSRDERLGVVHFETSCGWQSQRELTTATALLHLYQFADAEGLYESLIRRDPDCAIAYWGIAMSRFQNPIYALPTVEDENVARSALLTAVGARTAGPREREYLAAAGALFGAGAAPDWQSRERDYAKAMARIVAQYPQDQEAVIFYALALNLAAAGDDNGRADRTKAAELLLNVFSEAPDHPGIDHYLTYCLGHAAYQPKPFERAPMATTAQRLSLAAFALLTLCGLGIFVTFTADIRPGASSAAPIGGPFVLTAGDGTIVTDRTFRGRWMLVYFGYTHCPDVCPTTLLAIAQVLEKLGPQAALLQPLFVSIDPERDTSQTMEEFTKAFDPRIIGLTGKPAEIAAVARQYRVFFKKVPGTDAETYWMEHSSYIYVMGPDGRYVTLFSHDEAAAPDEMAARLRELLGASARPDQKSAAGATGTIFASAAGRGPARGL